MDNTDYCSYELAVKLKELGFDLECYEFWSTDFCTDGTPVKIRKSQIQPKSCVVSERNSVLEKIGSDLITAPTLAKAQKWLREEYGFHIHVVPCVWSKANVVYDAHWIWNSDHGFSCDRINGFKDYESALSAGISAALELIGKEGK